MKNEIRAFIIGFVIALLIGGSGIYYYSRRANNALRELGEIEQSKQTIDRELTETRASLESSIGRVRELESTNIAASEANSRLNDRLEQLEQIFISSTESNTDITDANRDIKEILDRIKERGTH